MSGLTAELWVRYRGSSDMDARAKLLDQYIGLVHHCARELVRRTGAGLSVDELVSAGTVGLVQALEGFDPLRGLAFSTYAVPRIRGAMLDELRGLDWTPRSVRARSRQLREVRARLQQALGRSPGETELAQALAIEVDTLREWEANDRDRVLLALEQPISSGSDEPLRLEETIADLDGILPEDELGKREALAILREAFLGLAAKDRLVISLHYFERLTLREIGELLHVTESRVSQIHSRALRRLRERSTLTREDL